MIYDNMARASLYCAVHPRFERAFAFLGRLDLDALPLGRMAIEGDDIFAMIQTYDTKPSLPRAIERHRTYIDIQFIVRGVENIGLCPFHDLAPVTPYDAAKDIEWLAGDAVEVPLAENHFMVIYPHEAHQPGLHAGGTPVAVKKIIVKVRYQ